MDTSGFIKTKAKVVIRIIFILILLLLALYWLFNEYWDENKITFAPKEGESAELPIELPTSQSFILNAPKYFQFQIDKVSYDMKDPVIISLIIDKNNGYYDLIKELVYGTQNGINCNNKRFIQISPKDTKTSKYLLKVQHPHSKQIFYIDLKINKSISMADGIENYKFEIQNFYISTFNNKVSEEFKDIVNIFINYFKCVVEKMNTS